jgi:prevent-host-death family protein
MRVLNIHEAKTNLSSVLLEVEKEGTKFLICRNGEPIAELVPHKKRSRSKLHPIMSKIKINYDPTEELTENEWGEIE